MPFYIGRGAIRRTTSYLEKGKIILRDNVKLMTFNLNLRRKNEFFPHHNGLKDFVFWHLAQLKYKNPNVEFYTFKWMTPTPFIRVYLDQGEWMLVDCDSQSREDIYNHVLKVFGKTQEMLHAEAASKASIESEANFGANYKQHCICEVPGQIPCSTWYIFPKEMTGRYKKKMKRELEEQEREATSS